jgi:hypothetical protein
VIREQHDRLIIWGERINSTQIVAQFFWARFGLPQIVCLLVGQQGIRVRLPDELVNSFASSIGDFISLEIVD